MLQPAIMFQDHMILQRDKEIKIWGTSDPNTAIRISIQGKTCSSVSDENGHWSLSVGPLRTSFFETVQITSPSDQLTFTDVQVGDVWLAAGQSNMEFFMRYDMDLAEELPRCLNENIRFFDYPEVSYPGQIDEADYRKNFGFWRKATPDDLEWFSAVAYYFAKDIQKKYQIPIGILGCNWGGTPACAWMDEQSIIEGGGQIWLEEYQNGLQTLDLTKYEEQFHQNPMSYRTDPFHDLFTDMLMRGAGIYEIIQKLTGEENPDLSKMDFSAQSVIGPKTETRPCGLYENMLTQTAPYGLRGILFYQGESDGDKHPELYQTMFPALIRCFRNLWQEELPFLFVQIAPFGSWMASVGEPYITIREAQQLVSETVPGTGMASTSDVGMELDIHPKKKQPVGHRLALQAMNKVYGNKDILCEAPTLVRAEASQGMVTLFFENAGNGLYLADHTPDLVSIDSQTLGGLKIIQDGLPLNMSDVTAKASGNRVFLKSHAFKPEASICIELGCSGWYRLNLYNSADIPAGLGRRQLLA